MIQFIFIELHTVLLFIKEFNLKNWAIFFAVRSRKKRQQQKMLSYESQGPQNSDDRCFGELIHTICRRKQDLPNTIAVEMSFKYRNYLVE